VAANSAITSSAVNKIKFVFLFGQTFNTMYTLMHGFYKYMTQKDDYCVVILGLDNAGKTVWG